MSIMRCTITGIYLAQKCQNVLHFNNPDGALSHINIFDELAANYWGVIRNFMNNQAAFTELRVQKIDGVPDTPSVFPISGVAGSLSGGGAPSFLCGLVRIKTASSGRHAHGRIYQWGVHGESVSNGIFQSGAWADWQTRWTTVQNRYKTGGSGPITLGVIKRGSVTTSDFYPMTALVVPQIFGVQRRRNIGVGA